MDSDAPYFRAALAAFSGRTFSLKDEQLIPFRESDQVAVS